MFALNDSRNRRNYPHPGNGLHESADGRDSDTLPRRRQHTIGNNPIFLGTVLGPRANATALVMAVGHEAAPNVVAVVGAVALP